MAPGAVPYVLAACLLVALPICLVTDLRARKIYDVVTIPTLVVALLARLLLAGLSGPFGFWHGLLGALIGFAVFFLLAWMGGMGMGDVKLVTAVGAVLGLERIVPALLFIAIAGGLQAIVATLLNGSLWRTLRGAAGLIVRRLRPAQVQAPSPGQYIPYGVAICAGTLWTVLWRPWFGAS